MTADEARAALIEWRFHQGQLATQRGQLVRAALAAGLTKQAIHDLSSIARTTIDRIVKEGTR